mgnify:CR=1 FL=1
MQLKDYIPKIDKKVGETFFSGFSFDSLKVKKNNIFFFFYLLKFVCNYYIDEAI